MTTHIKVDAWVDDDTGESSPGHIACGLEKLPDGDKFIFEGESYACHVADCQGCNPGGPQPYGTPISQLSSTPGSHGFERLKRIAESWGYE